MDGSVRNTSLSVGIMQPYFLPYIGYFQLIAAVDIYVLFDNIQYSKQGWMNRNRMLQNGNDAMFSLPLKKDTYTLDVTNRYLADNFDPNNLINKLAFSYKKAPFYSEIFPLICDILNFQDLNLFNFLNHSILMVCRYLDVNTKIIYSSSLPINHALRKQDKVIAICNALNATDYINSIGGIALYDKQAFADANMNLKFIRSDDFIYNQFDHEFIPWLSILDILMFNDKETVKHQLNKVSFV